MFEEELPESDSSDEDFIPSGEKSDVSEEESDDQIDDDNDDKDDTISKKNNKRKNKTKTKRKKKKKVEEELIDIKEEENELPKQEENPEEKKKKADALWADFLKDCGPVKKKIEPNQSLSQNTSESSSSSSIDKKSGASNSDKKINDIFGDFKTDSEQTVKVTEVYEFAGEKVIVEKKCDVRKRPVGGVAAILGQINKKTKLSTLEKSKLDWNSFKESQGISEDIAKHNRGKNGFLEKRDFLERADLRQFELEKKMREHTRSKRL